MRGGLHGMQHGTDPQTRQPHHARALTTREVRGIDQDVRLNRASVATGGTHGGAKGAAAAA